MEDEEGVLGWWTLAVEQLILVEVLVVWRRFGRAEQE
jgi:hypothetical protein